jgi:hypothetical protein
VERLKLIEEWLGELAVPIAMKLIDRDHAGSFATTGNSESLRV